jgi:hypothetical protein
VDKLDAVLCAGRRDRQTDWHRYLRVAARSPAASRLAPLYHAFGDIEAALCER